MGTFSIEPLGPFDLAAAAGFGFGPNAGQEELPMRLSFVCDDLRTAAAVTLVQDAGGTVHGETEGDADDEAVRAQAARILSLDGDGVAFAALGQRDPVLGELQRRYPGLRPVLFHSPYEAAAWAIISSRRPAAQAAVTRRELAERLGTTFAAGVAFPTPQALLDVQPAKGLPAVKVERLRAIAAAALDGALDADRLVAMDPADADAHLRALPGIGPFYAALILIRSVGHHDVAPQDERFHANAARYYGERPYAEIAEDWQPFRTWAAVLVNVAAMHDRVAEG